MNKYILVFLIFKTIALASSAVSLHNPASQFPPNFKTGSLPIPTTKGTLSKIRVKIFPHTLRNDWRHGVPDDPSGFIISSKELIRLTDTQGIKVELKIANVTTSNGLIILNSKFKFKPPLEFNANTPIKIIRKNNEDKSHRYTGHIKIAAKGNKLSIINTVDFKTYLEGVVPSESSSTWPIESLKAQALAARSYALYHLINSNTKKDWDVDDTARYQVYSGLDHRMPSTDQAVLETRNEVITYKGEVIIAFFHAYSGGWTDSARNIFGSTKVPYCLPKKEVFTPDELKAQLPVKSHWVVEWKKTWSKTKLVSDIIRSDDSFSIFDLEEGLWIDITKENENFESAQTIRFTQAPIALEINFLKLRKYIGWNNFNSYHFYLEDQKQDEIIFRGLGWGHHVGMSQWGAFMMAKFYGYDYKSIIKHYYQGVEITTIN